MASGPSAVVKVLFTKVTRIILLSHWTMNTLSYLFDAAKQLADDGCTTDTRLLDSIVSPKQL